MSSTRVMELMVINRKTGLAPFSDYRPLTGESGYWSWRRELSLTLSCYDLKKYIDAQAMVDSLAIKHADHEKHKPTRSALLVDDLAAGQVNDTNLHAHMLAEISFMIEMDEWLAIEKLRSEEAAGMAATKKLMSKMIAPDYLASIEDFDTMHAHEIIELLDERCQLKRNAGEALTILNAMKFDLADSIADYIIAGHECYLLAKEHDASLDQVVLHRALIAGLPAAFDKLVQADESKTVSLSFDLLVRQMVQWHKRVCCELGFEATNPHIRNSEAARGFLPPRVSWLNCD